MRQKEGEDQKTNTSKQFPPGGQNSMLPHQGGNLQRRDFQCAGAIIGMGI